MTSDALIVLLWLLCAHLVADFVFQTEWMATAKFGSDRTSWLALAWHILVVGIVLTPLAIIYGAPGLAFLLVSTIAHAVIDRTKIALTRRVEPQPPGGGEATAADVAEGPPLDRAWTPVPGALFVLDQLAHLVVLAVAWFVLLARTAPQPIVVASLDGLLGSVDRELFHRSVLTALVLVALAIINVRAASLFVGVLVRAPRARRTEWIDDPLHPGSRVSREARPVPAPPVGYTLRAGPIGARLEPDETADTDDSGADAARAASRDTNRNGLVSPARVGEAIGVLERLLIVGLVLTGAVASIGLVIAAKTLARFKQLDDREFAEYYLLGTLASVTVAVLSGLVAQAVLALP